MPIGTYSLFEKNGKVVAAAYEQAPDQKAQGMPAMWSTYFTVADVDLRTKEAEAAGGTVIAQRFDVEDAGRMSVIADPAGAVFCLWQAKNNIGAELMNEPNTLGWAECASTDVDKARGFYLEVMDWTHEEMDMGSQGMYTVFSADGTNSCGLYAQTEEGAPSSWLVYFDVADCEASTKSLRGLGGTVLVPPTMVPGIGTFWVALDPQGAASRSKASPSHLGSIRSTWLWWASVPSIPGRSSRWRREAHLAMEIVAEASSSRPSRSSRSTRSSTMPTRREPWLWTRRQRTRRPNPLDRIYLSPDRVVTVVTVVLGHQWHHRHQCLSGSGTCLRRTPRCRRCRRCTGRLHLGQLARLAFLERLPFSESGANAFGARVLSATEGDRATGSSVSPESEPKA